MDKLNPNKSEKSNAISLKRILIALTFSILLITSLLFGYLYFSKENILSSLTTRCENSEVKKVQEGEDGEESKVVCDFEKIKAGAVKDSSRVHLDYLFILFPNVPPSNPWAACKETLKSTIIGVIEKQEKYDSELLENLSYNVENDYIEYLIDDDFVIWGSDWAIWKVNILDESLEILWEMKPSYAVTIFDLETIHEDNTAKLLFGTKNIGIDEESYENMLSSSCKLGELGIWMYDTSTNAVTKIADSEQCK